MIAHYCLNCLARLAENSNSVTILETINKIIFFPRIVVRMTNIEIWKSLRQVLWKSPSLGEWKARLNPGEKPGKRNRWRRAGATLLGRSSPTNWESEKPTNWVKATLHSHHPSQWTHAAKQERIDIANVIWKCLNAALPSEHVRWQQSALKCMNTEMLL